MLSFRVVHDHSTGWRIRYIYTHAHYDCAQPSVGDADVLRWKSLL